MNKSHTAAQERAARDGCTDYDPRDRTLLVGIDSDECHHLLKTEGDDDYLLVVEDGTVVWRRESVDADFWMEHIADVRGWDDRRLGSFDQVFADELAELREGAA